MMASSNKRKSYVIRAKVSDVKRFALVYSDEVAQDAAIAMEAMRRIQARTGPGHLPLDVVSSGLPDRYLINWARKRLKKAA